MEHEELLVTPDVLVFPLLDLHKHLEMRVELSGRWEGNGIDTLERVIIGLGKPVRGTVLLALECLDVAGIWEMWPSAEVDHVTHDV